MEIRDICVPETYKDKTGQDKTFWHKIGTMFLQDDGRISMKFAAYPVGGQCNAFPKRPKNNDGFSNGAPMGNNPPPPQSEF